MYDPWEEARKWSELGEKYAEFEKHRLKLNPITKIQKELEVIRVTLGDAVTPGTITHTLLEIKELLEKILEKFGGGEK